MSSVVHLRSVAAALEDTVATAAEEVVSGGSDPVVPSAGEARQENGKSQVLFTSFNR
jgi:hypothetical protein